MRLNLQNNPVEKLPTLGVITDVIRKDPDSHANTIRPLMKLRRYTVDTAAAIMFFTPASMVIEIGISHMTLMQSLKARLVGNVINVLTGRPYGMVRDTLFKKMGTNEESGVLKKTFSDMLAFTLFQAPLYVGILAVAGADAKQIKLAVGSAIVSAALIGRPYGIWLDACRRYFGTDKKAPANSAGEVR